MTLKPADYVGLPCSCGQCVQAGMSDKSIRRDPHTGTWLHGYALKRWYESADSCLAEVKRLAARKVMP